MTLKYRVNEDCTWACARASWTLAMSGRRGQGRKTTTRRPKLSKEATPPPVRYDDDPRVLSSEPPGHAAQVSTRLTRATVSPSLKCNKYGSPSLKGKILKAKANTTVAPTEDAETANASPTADDNASIMDFEMTQPNNTETPPGLEATNSAAAAVPTEPETEVRLNS
jgi:hypothetical protein